MKSKPLGKDISEVEIQNVSKHGIWIWVKGEEFFLPHDRFPWFKKATIDQIHNVELLHGMHLYWADLDVDLEIDSLKYPDKYPLLAKPDK